MELKWRLDFVNLRTVVTDVDVFWQTVVVYEDKFCFVEA
jgi:hypothetical protein